MKKVLLYTTLGCHLCDQAEAIAAPVLKHYGYYLMPVEIADSDTLIEHYGVRIPVLQVEASATELAWPFTADDVEQLLRTSAA